MIFSVFLFAGDVTLPEASSLSVIHSTGFVGLLCDRCFPESSFSPVRDIDFFFPPDTLVVACFMAVLVWPP